MTTTKGRERGKVAPQRPPHTRSAASLRPADGACVKSQPDKQEQDTVGRELLARIGAGDRQALADLYLRYRQPLFQYLAQLTPDYGLAEELLQDTLVAVWRSANSFAGRSSALTWLIGVARRQAHNTLRQQGIALADVAAFESLAAPDADPADAALAHAAHADLLAAISRLSVIHREALILAFVHELSYSEMAEIVGVPVGTVKSRLNHARRALRAELARAPSSQPLPAPPASFTSPASPSATTPPLSPLSADHHEEARS